jgi:hypothetical protein
VIYIDLVKVRPQVIKVSQMWMGMSRLYDVSPSVAAEFVCGSVYNSVYMGNDGCFLTQAGGPSEKVLELSHSNSN